MKSSGTVSKVSIPGGAGDGDGSSLPRPGNRVRCNGLLEYKSFCVVWLQVFSLATPPKIESRSFCEEFRAEIDNQVFDSHFLERGLLVRFRLKGFDVSIKIDDDITISGHVHVEASLLFSATVSITYRLVVNGQDGFCRSSKSLTSDNLIVLAGIPLGVEHSYPSDNLKNRSWGVDFKVPSLEVSSLLLSLRGRVLEEPVAIHGSNEVCRQVMERYKSFFMQDDGATGEFADTKFVVVDIWEDIKHVGGKNANFAALTAPEIIAHIEEAHKDELMGLLTLYPFEWSYRDERAFPRVCGENIAIDTDDLVLVSDTVGLIIGTYGLRGAGSPTDWSGYLKERRSRDHVCWPECLHIIEIAIAQLHTINYALYMLHAPSSSGSPEMSSKSIIKKNSLLALNVGRIVTDMDAVNFSRYASHKRMFKEIEERLEIRRELDVLLGALSRVDTAIKNLDSVEELRRSRIIRTLLAFITIVSVFQVLFQELHLPILKEFWGDRIAKATATNILALIGLGLILMSGAAIMAGAIRLISFVLGRIRSRRM